MKSRTMLRRSVMAAPVILVPSFARGQPQGRLPAGPVRLLVGFPPGGTADQLARLIAAHVQDRAGLPIVVENRPGAGGVVATTAIVTGQADGSSMVLATMGSTIMSKLTYVRMPYDPQRDLAPITLAATFQLALAVHPSLPAETVPQFVAWARANPTQADFAIPAPGGHSQFFGVMLGKEIGVAMQPIPYRGSAPLMADLVAGQVRLSIVPLSDALALHRGGKVRIIATTGDARSLSAPDIPTFTEAGHPQLVGVGWLGVYAAARTPGDIVLGLNRAVVEALSAADIRERIVALGLEPRTSTPEGLAAFDETERQRWEPIVKATGFKIE